MMALSIVGEGRAGAFMLEFGVLFRVFNSVL